MGMEDVWVVVPVYNEAAVVAGVVAGLRTIFPNVLCVDDGSCDDSAEMARRAGARVLRHTVNLGQGAAIQTGLDYVADRTSAEWIVTFDADGQHRASDAAGMVGFARQEGIDLVLGSRFLTATPEIPWRRRLLLIGAIAATRITTRLPLTDAHNGLRVMSRQVAKSLDLRLSGMAHASELLDTIVRERWTYREFPVSIDYTEYSKAKGQSSINAVNIAFDLIVSRLLSST